MALKITCTLDCDHRIAAILYSQETMVCCRYIIVNTLYKGDDDEYNNTNNNNNNSIQFNGYSLKRGLNSTSAYYKGSRKTQIKLKAIVTLIIITIIIIIGKQPIIT
jgi:hypothetical protein